MRRGWRVMVGVALMLALVPTIVQGQNEASTGTAEWQASVLPRNEGDARVVGVAVGPDLMVAIGQRVCDHMTSDGARCWGQAWVSPDGTDWQAVDARTSGLTLGRWYPVISGPEVGLQGVAYGPAGFLAYGRVGGKQGATQRSAVWLSRDGLSWERVSDAGTFPRGTRFRTTLGAADGYLLGGVTYTPKSPRAAIWSSSDGRTWVRARGTKGDQTFEIGGYIDTMEDPAAGGIDAFAPYPGPSDTSASAANGVVAVGLACMPSFDRQPWAWNGACWGQLWRSDDGVSWHKDEGSRPRPYGAITHAASLADAMVVDAPVCLEACASALLLTDDIAGWRVAYGSPVDGELEALVAQRGRFRALLVSHGIGTDESTTWLTLWESDDGTDWTLTESQPKLPVTFASINDVDMVVADSRLVVTASGETTPDGEPVSVALLSPPLG